MLDKLISGALQGLGGGQPAASPLLQMVTSMLSSGGQSGGLAGLVQQFQQAGLGAQVNSWVSTGQNLPIDPQQLMQVFGQGNFQQMASQAGMDPQQLGGQLSQMLPQLIDQMTPQGQIPSGGVDDALAALSKLMK